MVGYGAYWLAGFVSRTIPRHFAYWLSLRIADLYFFCDRRGRSAVLANLKRIYAFKGETLSERDLRLTARRTFQHFGKYLVDFFRFSRLDEAAIRRLVTVERADYIEEASRLGKGVIMVTGHLGNWELGGAVMAALGHPLNVVVLNQPSAKLNDFFQKHRRRRGMTIIPLGHAVRALTDALRRREFVALLADRDYSRRNDLAPLCGGMACLPRGPVWLARATGAPILPGFVLRKEDDTFVMRLYPPIAPVEGTAREDLQGRLCGVLEDAICRSPHQWFMFEDVWSGQGYGQAGEQDGQERDASVARGSRHAAAERREAGCSGEPRQETAERLPRVQGQTLPQNRGLAETDGAAERMQRGCAVIPAYREAGRIGAVVRGALEHIETVIVVDDGSSDDTAREAEAAGAIVIRHAVNQGKGAALASGFQAAREAGFDYAVTMDGDGQHAPEDLSAFMRAYAEGAAPVLVGNRMTDTRTMPLVRRLTNRFMSWLLSRELGQRVPDTQCGYRLYDLAAIAGLSLESGRFAAESEILMALSLRGVAIGSVPVRTIYGTERSKIRPVKDTIRFFRMLRRFRKARASR